MVRLAFLLGITTLAVCLPRVCHSQTPHALLQKETAESGQLALAIMKKDPTWVTRRDSEQRTPLHIAARFNHLDVVKWLLANGADVDARAYNKFTPLHLTQDVEIVRLILQQKPNLKLKSAHGDTAVQTAIENLQYYAEISDPKPDAKRVLKSLKQIVETYGEYLGDDLDLISAIRMGQLDTVQKILTDDSSAAHKKGYAPNPLREAAGYGQLEICKLLIEKYKVDIDDFKGGTGYPIIKSALNHPKIVKYLVEQGADLQTRISWKGGRSGVWLIDGNATVLHFAASDGVPETVKILIDAGIDVFATCDSMTTKNTQTALELAAISGKTNNVLAILEHPKFKSGDVKIRQKVLDKSLVNAAYTSWLFFDSEDRAKLVEALITHGANVDPAEAKHSPIQIAASGIHFNEDEENERIKKIIAVLRKHGAKLDVFSAVAIGDLESLAKLLEDDPQAVESYSIAGYPAIHMAIAMNDPKAVKLLLDAGCDVEMKSKSELTGWHGESPLLTAAFWGRVEIAEMLISAGGDVNAAAGKQVTPLHEAVRMGNIVFAKLLLENGANKNAKDHKGETPLDWASSKTAAEKFAKLFSKFSDAKTAK